MFTRLGSIALNRSPLVRTLLASAALVAAVTLAGCDKDSAPLSGRALKPISDKLLTEIAQKDMTKESPILIRIFKQEAELEVWKEDSSGKLALLKTFPICRWSGELGPKIKEGDRQAPEGFYTITPAQMNPASQYYLAFNMGFPNTYDQANGRTGAHLMIHGDCSSRGCYAMTDEQIAEIYALARESFFGGQRAFQVQALPFRMTPTNMAKHRNNPHMPFWKMLKEGYDHFEVTRQEPKVDVCDRRYVFNAAAPENSSTPLNFSPRAQCPVFEVPDEIVAAVNDKKRRDEVQTAELINRGTPTVPSKLGNDGGMHEVFVAALQGGRAVKDKDGEIRGLVPVTAPGTIPATVNPPSNIALAVAPAEAEAANVPTPRPAARPSNSIMARAPAAAPAPIAPTQVAAAQPAAPAPAQRNFLGNLFTSNNSEAAAVTPSPPATSSPGVLDRAARAVGLRGSATAAAAEAPAAPAAASKPVAPASRPAPAVTTVAAQPKPQPLVEPATPPARVANAGAVRPQSQANEQAATAGPGQSASSASLLSGAPVVPSGSFGNSWSALR
jgi:murein L,D-transpeptidase YafK